MASPPNNPWLHRSSVSVPRERRTTWQMVRLAFECVLIAGLLIFAIGFALGFFVCILGFIAEKNRIAAEKEDSKETSRNNTTVKGGGKDNARS